MSNWQPIEAALKRYDLITNYRCGSSIEEMEQSDNGDWVRFEDVLAALAGEGEPEKTKDVYTEGITVGMELGRALATGSRVRDTQDAGGRIAKIQRVANLVANLAHREDDHRENLLEDEAHDLLRELRQQFTHLEAEVARLKGLLAECFRLSGADPDGNEDWRLADDAVRAVQELRADYDDACNEVAQLTEGRDASRRVAEAQHSSLLRLKGRAEAAEAEMVRLEGELEKADKKTEFAVARLKEARATQDIFRKQWSASQAQLTTLHTALEKVIERMEGRAEYLAGQVGAELNDWASDLTSLLPSVEKEGK